MHEVLRELGRKRRDPWGEYAENLANGIARSGLPALLERSAEEARRGLDDLAYHQGSAVAATQALAAINTEGFEAVHDALIEQTRALGTLAQLIANPLGTRADERFRRGMSALQQGWYSEAVTEFQSSLGDDPYRADAHYYLGVALTKNAALNEAYDSFCRAVYYSGNYANLRPTAAGAAVLGAQLADKLGRPADADAIVRAALDKVTDCAELWLALASRGGGAAELERALRLAPELAVLGLVADIDDAERVALRVHDDPDGPVQAARRAEGIARSLGWSGVTATTVPQVMGEHRSWVEGIPEMERAAWTAVERSRSRVVQDQARLERRRARQGELREAATKLSRQHDAVPTTDHVSEAVGVVAFLVAALVCWWLADLSVDRMGEIDDAGEFMLMSWWFPLFIATGIGVLFFGFLTLVGVLGVTGGIFEGAREETKRTKFANEAAAARAKAGAEKMEVSNAQTRLEHSEAELKKALSKFHEFQANATRTQPARTVPLLVML